MPVAYYLQLYLTIFLLILFGYYLLPAGTTYFIFYIFQKGQFSNQHIQKRYPTARSIRHEIKWSLIAISLFALLTLLLYQAVVDGYTKMYFTVSERGWLYLVGSAFLSIVLYDTYYYWMHRFMHLKKVFPYVHKVHHRSHTPSPWSILAFSPLEAVLEFLIYPLLLFLLPMHPLSIGFFVLYNIVLNTGGHIGFEIIPKSFFHHRLLRYGLTVTHHDMHHSKINCNYGIYFNFWDRLMHTNHNDYEKTFLGVKEKTKES